MIISILLFSCSKQPSSAEVDEIEYLLPTATEAPLEELRFVTPSVDRPKIGNAGDRMAGPVLPENPTQADLGTEIYWQKCMACHGDQGQGLTDEWRGAWGPEHMDCWQSKCHSTNHPPDGFVMLRYAPEIVNQYALNRFETAQDYFDYISVKMPWWNPGSLPEEEYWQLTAYLLRENGIEIVGEIDAINANRIILTR